MSLVDRERLRTWIQQKDLPREDFANALAVLGAQNGESKEKDANLFLSDMLVARTPYDWMRKQPDKIEIILDAFRHEAMGEAATRLLEWEDLSEPRRIKAAGYLARVGYEPGVESLIQAFENSDSWRFKAQVLESLASVGFDRPQVGKLLEKVVQEPPTTESVDAIVTVIHRLATQEPGSQSALPEESMLRYASENGMRLIVKEESSLFANMRRETPKPGPQLVWLYVYDDNGGHSRWTLSITEFTFWKAYQKLLQSSFSSGKIETGFKLLPTVDRKGGDILFTGPRLRLRGDATLSLTGSDGVTQQIPMKSLKNPFISLSARQGAKPRVAWYQTKGPGATALLAGISGPVLFQLVAAETERSPNLTSEELPTATDEDASGELPIISVEP